MIKNPNLSDCAIKVFQIWKKLTFEGKAKSDLLEDFSDDSLNFYLNTLRELEIKLSLQDSKPHKISIVDNINLLNLNENDIEFLEKLKEALSNQTSYLPIKNFNEFLFQLSQFTNKYYKEKLFEIANKKPLNIEIHKKIELLEKCIKNNIPILISYQSPNSSTNYFKLIAQEIKLENSKLYLLGYDENIVAERYLRIERIKSIREIIKKQNNSRHKVFAICEFEKENLNYIKNEKEIEFLNDKNKIIVKIFGENNFKLLQRLLYLGTACKIIEPKGLDKKIKEKIKLILENYEK